MADRFSKETRSRIMSSIKGIDTKPELIVRKFLFKNGFRYRLHVKKLPGKPDIVLPKYQTVIFVNGCFWHGHKSCKDFVLPKTRDKWWKNKIDQNKKRDKKNIKALQKLGWRVLEIFECEINDKYLLNACKSISKIQ